MEKQDADARRLTQMNSDSGKEEVKGEVTFLSALICDHLRTSAASFSSASI
jgi:hypothetical protein